jgi:hypothetical protein
MKVVKLSGHKSVDLIIKGQGIYLFDFDPVDDPVDNPVDQVDEVDELDGLDDPIKLVKQVKPVKLLKCTDPKAKFTLENANGSDGLKIVFTNSYVNVSRIGGTEQKYLDPMNNSGLSKYTGAYYWFSIDSQNQTLRLGIGEARIETMIYNFTFIFQ